MAVADIPLDKRGLCYLNNDKLKKAHIKIPYTQEQVDEFIKCQKDVKYFIENYVKIVSLDHGLVNFDMYDFQRELIDGFTENRFSINLLARQMGKCLGSNINVRIRNKKTGDVYELPIGDFYNMQRNRKNNEQI